MKQPIKGRTDQNSKRAKCLNYTTDDFVKTFHLSYSSKYALETQLFSKVKLQKAIFKKQNILEKIDEKVKIVFFFNEIYRSSERVLFQINSLPP